jgi:hypothetical protein
LVSSATKKIQITFGVKNITGTKALQSPDAWVQEVLEPISEMVPSERVGFSHASDFMDTLILIITSLFLIASCRIQTGLGARNYGTTF